METIIEQFPEDHPNIRHIYNCRSDIIMEESEGRGVVQQFLHLARESHYIYWVMADDIALKVEFPHTTHLLCRWHINKDVEAYVTGLFKDKTVGAKIESQHSAVKSWMESSTGSLDTVWARVHFQIGNLIVGIHNALEASRSKVGEKYRHMPLQRLNGKVSHHCLSVLYDETERMRELSYEVHVRCDCALRITHGIPCACQIYDSMHDKKRLYCNQIHPFRQILVIGDGVDIPQFVDESAEEATHFRSLVDEVLASDLDTVRNVSRIIEDELHPNHSDLEDPEVNHSTWGRPRDRSTRCDRSHFENVERGNGFNIEQCRYAHLLPGPILPYITGWNDVIGDSNCGFHCVATLFMGDQEQWILAQQFMDNEITEFISPRCWCKPPKIAKMKISTTNRNPRKAFFKCNDCGFFKWLDESDIEGLDALKNNSNGIEAVMLNLEDFMSYVREIVRVGVFMYVILVVIFMLKNGVIDCNCQIWCNCNPD
ncbi:uncharacterized protein LOC110734894 [Chenopodium quinoa]|uniref:uncharacterized protein LOC110734894 n=1 Tax=Chenopodium quinoa TaxID=63459 RepID=UPI000B76F76D|nr:uncharacterized protein LOC110734894 [Chenopodium quinoa]